MLVVLRPIYVVAGLIVVSISIAQAAQPPRVVVSIAPLHSLVAGVMEGVAVPALLVQGNASIHTYTLRPSQVRALNHAQVVFRIGSELESFLNKPLAALNDKVRIINLIDWPGMTLLPTRSGGLWGQHTDHHGKSHYTDNHIWLDPGNAKVIVSAAVEVLSEIDPERAARYRNNGKKLRAKLDKLDQQLSTTLAPVKTVPYLVFHDAYHYFEARYGLNAAGAVTPSPEHIPGARRLREVRKYIRTTAARCLFREPQFSPAWLQLISEGTQLKIGTLDPLGATLKPGPELYFTLMHQLAKSLTDCLDNHL